ncbi:unnamed protein product [Ectocarpus sp. CCAP 1310/34]|nr:unnamed protein product [Ectocarpus sp. CCAP 1310/34]
MSSGYRKDGNVATNNLGMRKSCGACGRKKRKCDGLMPCSRCLRAGVRCTYSKRKPHQPQLGRQHQRRPRGPAGVQTADMFRPSASGTLLPGGMLPLKRLKLSASPATGLVGMQENAFLSDFFGCVGFMPFTSRSHIRGAMVRMMARSTAQHQPGARHNSPEQSQFGDTFTEDGITPGNQLLTGPSCCTFWCAVGMGALAKGSPVESVANYSRLARDAMDAYTGPVDADVAEAWAILGYFYGFMGDTATFEEYLKLSDSFLIASIEQGSTGTLPSGFPEIVHYKECVKVFCGNVDAVDTGSFTRHQDRPQINPAATEEDVFRFVAQSVEAFVQLVVEEACGKRATRSCSSDDGPYEEDRGDASPHGNAPRVEEISDAMVTGFKIGLLDFENLQEAVDLPNVRTGMGGFLINMNLVFHRAANGDAVGMLEKIGHCVEVLERYPGVCRFMLGWCHLVHAALAALAAMDDCRARGLYNRLREAYNQFRPSASLPAPPLEAWQGLSAFCDHFHCMLFGGVIASERLSVFTTPPYSSRNGAGFQQDHLKGEDVPVVDEEHHIGIVWGGVTPEEATSSIMDVLCSNGDKPMASTSSWEWNHERALQMSPPARSRPSSSNVHRRESSKDGIQFTDLFSNEVERCGEDVFSGVMAQYPDDGFTLPELRELDGTTQDTMDDAIAVPDWLDTTHAMLDEVGDKSPGI